MQKNNSSWTPQQVFTFQDRELNYLGGKVLVTLSSGGGWDLFITNNDGMTRREVNIDILTVCLWLNDFNPNVS